MLLTLVHSFAAPGWFMHLAFMEDIKGRFDELHNAAVGALSDAGVAELPHGKHLLPGDYKEPARPLRRNVAPADMPHAVRCTQPGMEAAHRALRVYFLHQRDSPAMARTLPICTTMLGSTPMLTEHL